jgi:NADH:ubiquinone oxidoreductase subunit F (NADH-binding)
MGTTLKEVIFDIGDGITNGKKFKAVQTGGPSGGCLPEEYLDLPIDYDSLISVGTMMGSGGMVVMDEDSCMVDVARFFLNFTQSESCGKCTPCREGTKRMLEILNRICDGEGKDGDIELLQELGEHIKSTSLCGLGQSAPNPVLSTIRHFRDEYEAHIHDHNCPAGVCSDLAEAYVIDEEACIGCSKCSRVCPVGAISGEIKNPFTIDPDVCIACGACEPECPVSAISQG